MTPLRRVINTLENTIESLLISIFGGFNWKQLTLVSDIVFRWVKYCPNLKIVESTKKQQLTLVGPASCPAPHKLSRDKSPPHGGVVGSVQTQADQHGPLPLSQVPRPLSPVLCPLYQVLHLLLHPRTLSLADSGPKKNVFFSRRMQIDFGGLIFKILAYSQRILPEYFHKCFCICT